MGIKSSSLRCHLNKNQSFGNLELHFYIFGGGKGKSQNSWPGVGSSVGLKFWCVLASKYCTLLLGSVLELCVYRVLYVFLKKISNG